MRFWTFLKEEDFTGLMESGVYRQDPLKTDPGNDDRICRAHDFLVREMEIRIGKAPEGVKYPVFAWAVYGGRQEEPVRKDFGNPGDPMVMVCAEMPQAEAVLFDYYYWHCLLNDLYIPDCHTQEEFDRDLDRHNLLPGEEKEKEKEGSWQKMFDLRPADNGFFKTCTYVQAAFWELRKENLAYYESFPAEAEE